MTHPDNQTHSDTDHMELDQASNKQLSFGETVKLITDFSQELRKQPFPATNPDVIKSLIPISVNKPIPPRIEQRRFLADETPTMIAVKKIENGNVTAEELTRDGSHQPRVIIMSEDEFSKLPYECPFFFNCQSQYEEYCNQRNVIPFQGFRTIDDMRLFHCGFWLNFTSVPKKASSASSSSTSPSATQQVSANS